MRCQNCGNEEVNFRYSQIINGKKKELNLCTDCAGKLGLDNIEFKMPVKFSSLFENSIFDMPRLGIENIFNYGNNCIEPLVNREDEEILNERALEEKVKNLVESRAKIRDNSKEKTKLKFLEERLKKEIKEERYEDAAKTRDEIKKLK